ncbi:MAG: sugar phosphate isomerase/epimerase family protein [Phycisphaerales bacterium]
MKPAFSTVACPHWTLDQIAERAEPWGYQGIELRTFGSGSTQFAGDPALTAPSKTRLLFDRAGIDLACLATSIRFDAPLGPPLLGHVLPSTDTSIAETKDAISLAAKLECPFIRVFGFEIMGSESKARAIQRIASRLALAADACRNRGVRLLIENGGSFATSTDLAEIIDQVNHPLVSAAYSVAAAHGAGEHPSSGINVLSDRLELVRLKDYRGGKPVALGSGEIPNKEAVRALAAREFEGWLVYEYPAAWITDAGGDVVALLAEGSRAMYSWLDAPAKRPAPASV